MAGDVTLKLNLKLTLTHGIYESVVCQYNSENHRHVWKHYRTQHLYIHTHICKVKGCKDGKNNKPYGNDEQHTVWAHMATAHKVPNPMSCPKCKNLKGFLQRKGRGTISKIVKSLRGRAQRNLVVILLGVGRGTKLNRH